MYKEKHKRSMYTTFSRTPTAINKNNGINKDQKKYKIKQYLNLKKHY